MRSAKKDRLKTTKKTLQSLTLHPNAAIIPQLLRSENLSRNKAKKVPLLQIVAVVVVALVLLQIQNAQQFALAVFVGGGVSILNATLIALRMHGATTSHQTESAHKQLTQMYYYAAERFLAVTMALGACIVVLKVNPIALLCGFILGQIVMISAQLFMNIKTKENENV